MSDECKAMERPAVTLAPEFRVTESSPWALRCTKFGAGRIKVRKWNGGTGKGESLIVAWDYALGHDGNYANAVAEYLAWAGLAGEWAVALCDGGAVAVQVPGTAL